MPCSAVNRDGKSCGWHGKIRETPDGPRCWAHDPRRPARRAEKSAWPLGHPLATPEDATALAAWAAQALVEGTISPSVCRELSVVIKSFLAGFDVARMQGRVKELAKIIERLQGAKKEQ